MSRLEQRARIDGGNAKLRVKLATEQARVLRLENVLTELVEVADLRGDSELPHPADDPKTWTARMQTAWDEAHAALGEVAGDG